MARQKRSSPILGAARRRLNGLKAINPKPNYGPGLTVEDFEKDIVEPENLLNRYNQMSSEMDDILNQIQAGEARANDKSTRIALKYGFLERPKPGMIRLSALGRKVLRPQQPKEEISGLREAVLKAPEFSDVYKHYRGENLPDEQFLDNASGGHFSHSTSKSF
jgi:hypothetical protein